MGPSGVGYGKPVADPDQISLQAPSRRSHKNKIVLEWLRGRPWAGLALRSRPMVPPDASEPAEPNKNDAMGHGYAERENCIQCIHVGGLCSRAQLRQPQIGIWVGFWAWIPIPYTPGPRETRVGVFSGGYGAMVVRCVSVSLQYIHTWNH